MVLLCVVKWPFETWEFKIRTFMAQKQNKKMFGIAIKSRYSKFGFRASTVFASTVKSKKKAYKDWYRNLCKHIEYLGMFFM